MFLDIVGPRLGAAASLFGAGAVVLGQAVFDTFADPVERIVGGSVLFGAAILIVRWTFKLLTEARAQAQADREAFLQREAQLIDQIAALNAQLLTERQARMSLEAMGYEDRRKRYSDGDPP